MSTPTPPGQTPAEKDLVEGVAALLAVSAAVSVTAPAIASLLKLKGKEAKTAATIALQITGHYSGVPANRRNPFYEGQAASDHNAALEPYYRAAYTINATRRIHADLQRRTTEFEALHREETFYNAHRQAQERRQEMAARTDAQAQLWGTTLGWYTVKDNRTTQDCLNADGKNFDIHKPPAIGYPGTVHARCRCKAGPPHKTSKTVDGKKKSRATP